VDARAVSRTLVKRLGGAAYLGVVLLLLALAVRGALFPANASQTVGFFVALALSTGAATRVSTKNLRSFVKLGVAAFVIAVVVLMFIGMEQGLSDSACSDFPDQPGCRTPDWFSASVTSLAAFITLTALIVVARSGISRILARRRTRTG
jgi:hypothetical protein